MSQQTFNMPEVFDNPEKRKKATRPPAQRNRINTIFKGLCSLSSIFTILLLGFLICVILWLGIHELSVTFLTAPPHPDPEKAGFFPAIMGSIWLLILVPFFALPAGIATAVILEEFSPRNAFLKKIHSVLQLNITNLAGVPSVVYGIIGITLFAYMFGFLGNEKAPWFETGVEYYDQFYSEADKVFLVPVTSPDSPETVPVNGMTVLDISDHEITLNVIEEDAEWPENEKIALRTIRVYDTPGRISRQSWLYFRIPFGRGILTGALTLVLVILPVIIISSQEALRAVPFSLREAAWGLGLTRWQAVRHVVLPSALPTIMTGTILAVSRAIGEAAPLLMIAGIVFISNPPGNIMDDFTAMPLQIYNWAQRPQKEFHDLAASGIVVLLSILMCFNGLAIYIRNKSQKSLT